MITSQGLGSQQFEPTSVQFIKLGEGGRWQQSCIDEGTIRLGYESDQHLESLSGQWDLIRDYWLRDRRGKAAVAASDLRQIRSFYELPDTTLWITFHNRHLYWCFADSLVTELSDKSRIRKVKGKWSCSSLNGTALHLSNVDGRVTKVQGFRGTICNVERSDYLIRKIRDEKHPEVIEATALFNALKETSKKLIQGLWWHDFELLADLIFVRSGWQRVSVLGKTERDVAWDMIAPVTNKRAFIQVKSTADFSTFHSSLSTFRHGDQYSEMYFVVHTISDDRILNFSADDVTIVGPDKIAELTINAGLIDWLIKKCE